jgi:hypothetical protein
MKGGYLGKKHMPNAPVYAPDAMQMMPPSKSFAVDQ